MTVTEVMQLVIYETPAGQNSEIIYVSVYLYHGVPLCVYQKSHTFLNAQSINVY